MLRIVKLFFIILFSLIFLIIGNYFSKVFAGYYRFNVEQVYSSDHFNFLKPHFEIVKPSSGKKFPTVIMFHACGGPYPYLDSWQKFFSDSGIASIQVDSTGPRGMNRRTAIRTVCSGFDLQGQERAGDASPALSCPCRSKPEHTVLIAVRLFIPLGPVLSTCIEAIPLSLKNFCQLSK